MSTNYLMPDWEIHDGTVTPPIRECRTHTVDEPKRDDFWERPKGTMPNPWLVELFGLLAVVLYCIYLRPSKN